jgi:hypothetical protein
MDKFDEEKQSLVRASMEDDEDVVILRIPSMGRRFSTGFASSYGTKCTNVLCFITKCLWFRRYRYISGASYILKGNFQRQAYIIEEVLPDDEIREIIHRLNDTILSFWPCSSCYLFGVVKRYH